MRRASRPARPRRMHGIALGLAGLPPRADSMRKLLVPAALATLPLLAAPAFASSFAGSTAGTSAGGSSASSGSTSGDDKIVLQARDDAACFVASDGAIRGAM